MAVLARLTGIVVLAVMLALVTREQRPRDATGSECRGCSLVLISADTLRADHLGCYGYARDTSPAIDRFATRSLRFANAYSASAWTLPGHLAMLTGRYPTRESEFAFLAPAALPDSTVTLAQVLKSAGYATAGFTGGGYVGEALGFGRGFDVYSSASERFAGNQSEVARWLDGRDAEQPFFLFFHGYDVHAPYDPPEELRRRTTALEVPEKCRGLVLRCGAEDYECLHGPGGREYLVAQYDAEIGGVDAAVQWLLDQLERRGLAQNTIVVFVSDHGENLMDDAAGVCGHAGDLREPVFRVPLILHVPGARAGTVDTRVSLVDLAPTLLGILGVAAPPAMHGENLADSIRDGAAVDRQINGVTALDPGYDILAAIAGNAKLVAQRPERSAPWTYQLFDLARDPAATRDLANLEPPPAELAVMKERLFAWTTAVGLQLDDVGPPAKPLPDDVRERLRALGYR